jgi:hypothetical protein
MDLLESDLINKVRPKLKDRYHIYEEVGLINRSIDMVLFDQKSLITIEFKIRDWRKAVTQIQGHLIAADYAYLCMPYKKISEKLEDLLTKNGIGLWLYDIYKDELIEAMKPSKSRTQWTLYRKSLIDRLSKGGAQ